MQVVYENSSLFEFINWDSLQDENLESLDNQDSRQEKNFFFEIPNPLRKRGKKPKFERNLEKVLNASLKLANR